MVDTGDRREKLAGDFLIIGVSGGAFTSCPMEQMAQGQSSTPFRYRFTCISSDWNSKSPKTLREQAWYKAEEKNNLCDKSLAESPQPGSSWQCLSFLPSLSVCLISRPYPIVRPFLSNRHVQLMPYPKVLRPTLLSPMVGFKLYINSIFYVKF
jgi:hypothetical protein